VRACLGHEKKPIVVGDRLVNLINHDGMSLMNGEVRVVERAARSTGPSWMHRAELWEVAFVGGETALVNVDLIGKPVSTFKAWRGRKKHLDRVLHVDYGFCLTVHKAQGSQWAAVGFVACPTFRRMSERRRLAYTAITRASDRLVIFAD
jgi:exodeoxyribonuclease-5